jgi:hypothetical protein
VIKEQQGNRFAGESSAGKFKETIIGTLQLDNRAGSFWTMTVNASSPRAIRIRWTSATVIILRPAKWRRAFS